MRRACTLRAGDQPTSVWPRRHAAQGTPYGATLWSPTAAFGPRHYTGLVKAPSTDQPPRDRADNADRSAERQPRRRRSGEGSESALANLRTIELDRQKTRASVEDRNTPD